MLLEFRYFRLSLREGVRHTTRFQDVRYPDQGADHARYHLNTFFRLDRQVVRERFAGSRGAMEANHTRSTSGRQTTTITCQMKKRGKFRECRNRSTVEYTHSETTAAFSITSPHITVGNLVQRFASSVL